MPSPRSLSFALLALLVVGPWAGVAQAQGGIIPGVVFDFEVEPGAVKLIQNGKATNFLSSNETFAINVTIQNYGTSSTSGVPVFWWFGDQRGCMRSTTVPARESIDEPGIGWAQQPEVLLNWQLNNTTAYNVNVSVNERPPVSVVSAFPNHCNTSSYNPVSETELRNADEVDNTAWGYFVKDKRIDLNVTRVDWCRPNGDECLVDMHSSEIGDWYNSTAYDERLTFFNITIANDGEWRYMVDNSSADCERDEDDPYTPIDCPEFAYDIEARLFGPGLAATGLLLEVDTADDENLRWSHANITSWGSADFDLEDRAGNYTLTVTVDPLGKVRQSAVNDKLDVPVQVRHVELRPWINVTEFRTDPADPYPFAAGTRINGSVAFLNEGIMNLTAERDVDARVYIDDPDGAFAKTATFVRATGTTGHLNTGKVFEWFNVTAADGWTISTNEESPYYLSPGSHKLVAEIDMDEVESYRELNETDNRTEITIYVQDTGAPRIWTNRTNPLVRPSTDISEDPDAASFLDLHPFENFTVRAFADDTEAALNVTANFTLKSDENVTRQFRLGLLPSQVNWYSTAAIRNFSMNDTNASEEEWTLVVEVRDSTGNLAKTAPVTVKFTPWPIQKANTSEWIIDADPHGTPDNVTRAWSDESHDLNVHIKIPNSMTGWDQHNYTANIWMIIDPPGDDAVGRVRTYAGADGHWAHPRGQQDVCAAPSAKEDDGLIGGIGSDPDNPTDPCPYYGEFTFSTRKYDGRPGAWNYSIVVRDISGVNRTVNRTVTFLDEAPEFRRYTLEKEKIEAGVEPANLTVEWVEDFNVSRVYLNLSIGEKNITSVPLTKSGSGSDGSLERTWWNTTLPTGRGTLLGIAGNFTSRVAAVDVNGNWGLSPTRTLEIVDSRAPTMGAAGVTPPAQEIGANVTFHAQVSDQTNSTVVVRLFHDGEEVWNASLETTDGGNFSITRNFTEKETYTWEMQAFDGNLPTGIASDVKRGTLIIDENLGPRYDVLAPSFTVGGERFGKASQRVSVLVYDNDGVDKDSLNFTVDGVQITGADLRVDPAPAGYVGWTLSYAIPSAAGYSHNDTVEIGLAAVDLSNESLASVQSFTFRVDDEAPTSRLVRLEPRFRVNESDPWYVSLDSRFEFAATDNDGMPTGVQTIRYAVIGGSGGSDVETVYTGPFTIDSVGESYSGPKAYLVEYWAEDEVGNVESPIQRVPVTVDVQAPNLDIYGSLPSGQFINVTIQDHQAGVRDVVVWYSLNGSPYQPISLEPTGDTWRGVLPEGRKGERMTYYLQAWDNVNNTRKFGNESEPHAAYTVGNHVPDLRIDAPAAGARVSRMLDLRWTASDEDGEDLSYVVYLKAPGRANFVELSRIGVTSQRTYQLDTTRYADGEYMLAVTASDGSFVARAETAVVFLNSARPVGNVTAPGSVTPGEDVLITAEVTKAGAAVEARLFRDGDLVDAFTMNDDGRDGDLVPSDGIYSVRVALDRSGDYSVEIVTRYQENGEEVESKVQGPAFTVRLTPGAILAEYAVLWVTLLVLVLGAVGVAGFALYRKWR